MVDNLKAVLFDLGSTLLEYEKFDWIEIARRGTIAGTKFLRDRGIEAPEARQADETFHRIFTQWKTERDPDFGEINFQELITAGFKEMGLPDDEDFIIDFIKAYYQPVTETVEHLDGSAPTLKLLKEKGLRLVIVSNSIFPAYLHLGELEKFQLLPYLDGMIFSCELGIKKPHPDIYVHALQIADCTPEEAVFVGDRYLEDLEGPSSVGIKAVLRLKPGRDYPPEIENYPVIDSVAKLPELLGLV
ncbi:MAG: HAD-IA family hydrolase [candidate division Zixibacteria bacterium]|nr:HAD-IA family hydrolase [candidate division Zixibacteria bacterium]